MGETEIESLRKVDKVNELIKKLAENNGHDSDTLDEVDEYLKNCNSEKIGLDKTSINKSTNKVDEISRDSFMSGIELDAKERADRKAESRKRADLLKIKANDYFKACDFKKAVELYSKAVETCNDWNVLYTNRAQAFIKLNLAQLALDDCELALRLSGDNHKALLHKGRALVRLNKFDEAIICYKQVLHLAPNLKKYMQEFFDEAEQLKRIMITKETSISVFEGSNSKGDVELDFIMEKLLTNGSGDIEFYAGGLQLLIAMLRDNDNYVNLVRRMASNSSVGLFAGDCKIQTMMQAIVAKKVDDVNDGEWNLLFHWMELFGLLIKNDIQFAVIAINTPALYDYLIVCVTWCGKMPSSLLLSVASLFYYLSCAELAVQQIFDKFSLNDVMALIIKAIDSDKHSGLNAAGIGLFQNLMESQRFKTALGKEGEQLNAVIDCLHALFASSSSSGSDHISSIISIIDSLSENSAIRLRLIRHEKFLNECMNTIEARMSLAADSKHADILLKLFTFIHNLLILTKNIPTGNKVKLIGHRVVISASFLLENHDSVEMRSVLIQVLSQMLVLLNDDQLRAWCDCPSNNDSAISLCRSLSRKSSLTDQNYIEKVCKTLRLCIAILDAPSHHLLSSAVKILTLASRVSQAVIFLCCDIKERTLKLQSLIYKDKEPLDEVLAGNICLLLTNSVNDTPLAEHLSNSNIVKDLLRVCADATKNDCRRNAAILAGKLAQSSHLHKNELSRLNGFSIISKFSNWS